MLASTPVLEALADHLTVADVYRLRRALGVGADELLPPDVASLVASRMHVKPRLPTFRALGERMANGRHCAECGIPCRRALPVCAACSQSDGPRGLYDRVQVRALARAHGVRGVDRLLRTTLRPVRRESSGRLLYWRVEVHEVVLHRSSAP
jgi:hypothetical protein